MAKARLDPLIIGLSGTIGDFVFRRSKNGETIISKRPRKTSTPPTEAQQAQQQRFGEASKYASAALADPVLRAVYEDRAAEEGTSAFAAARKDYFQGNDLLAKK
jgi:hypothetical protein